jgi:hypothetical protein
MVGNTYPPYDLPSRVGNSLRTNPKADRVMNNISRLAINPQVEDIALVSDR